MGKVKDVLEIAIDKAINGDEFNVCGKLRKVKGLSSFSTKNYDDEYYKFFFDDGAFLMLVPGDDEVYFTEKHVDEIESIPDAEIGKPEILLNAKKFILKDKNNYQFVKQRYVGGFKDVEGEVSFSDYEPAEGEKEILSLGFLSFTGKRADIQCKLISMEDVGL